MTFLERDKHIGTGSPASMSSGLLGEAGGWGARREQLGPWGKSRRTPGPGPRSSRWMLQVTWGPLKGLTQT